MREPSSLTKRESDVLVLGAKGKHNKAIAYQLGISENTVEKHLQHIYAKLSVRCRTEAALRFLAKEKMAEIRN